MQSRAYLEISAPRKPRKKNLCKYFEYFYSCCYPIPKIFHPRKIGEKSVSLRQISRTNAIDSNRNLNESNLDSSLDTLEVGRDANCSEIDISFGLLDFNLSFNTSDVDNLDRTKMDPDVIYKALRPIPEFDGNPNVLTRFIRICDQIVLAYVKNEPGNELANLCLINGILNKITGAAARTINSNGIPENWLGIRNSLINNFADQRDETALYNDLSIIHQGNDTPQEYYDKCQNLFSTIMTYVSLHESVATTVEAKRDLYRKLTMQAYVRGLKEPLGSRIRCMRPTTIEKALEFVQEELNIMYLQRRNETSSDRRPPTLMQPTPKVPYLGNSYNNATPKMLNMHSPGPSWQRPMPPIQGSQPWRPNLSHHVPQRVNHQPSRTQQVFGAQPPNYNNSGFRVPPRNIQPQSSGPKPMSGVSHFVSRPLPPRIPGHDWQRHGNPPPSNYFKTREINFNETYEDYDCYDQYYDQYEYNDYYNNINPFEHQSNPQPYDYPLESHPQYPDSSPIQTIESPQPSTSQQEQDFTIGRRNPELK